jgi:hypothetical protein
MAGVCHRAQRTFTVGSGRPFTYGEGGLPEAEGPEHDRDEILNPVMKQRYISCRCRQMRSSGVGEDANYNVDYNQKSSCTEKSFDKGHLSSPPFHGRRLLYANTSGNEYDWPCLRKPDIT